MAQHPKGGIYATVGRAEAHSWLLKQVRLPSDVSEGYPLPS